MNNYRPISFKNCFNYDINELNKLPKSLFAIIVSLLFSARYSMPVFMRLTQYYYYRKELTSNKYKRYILNLFVMFFLRYNESK